VLCGRLDDPVQVPVPFVGNRDRTGLVGQAEGHYFNGKKTSPDGLRSGSRTCILESQGR